MDFSKMKTTDWLVGGGAVVYLVGMFLPWFKVDAFGFSASVNGWEYEFFGIIPLLLIAAVFTFTVLPSLASGVKVPDTIGPMPKAQAALIGAGVAAVLVLLRLIIKDDGGVEGAEDFIDRGIGLFICFVAAAAVAVGAFLKYQGKEPASPSSSAPPTPF